MRKKFLIFGSILLIAALAVSAELESFYKSKWGGLNSSVNVRLLQDDEAYDLSNFSLEEIGAIKERDVFGQYNSSSGILGSNFITGLFKHYTSDSKFFFAAAGTKIGLGSAGAFTDITPTNSSVIAGSYYSGVSFNNKFYLFNPLDEMFVYGGSGSFHKLGNSSAIPSSNCSYSAVHKARVWAARSNTYPYRLYWSSLNTAENWTNTGGYADLPDITQEITGIISWGGYLYIFTETNVYILLGSTPNDFSLRKTNSMVGAIAPRSIKITDIGICFLSRSGVYAFDGNNSNKLSTKIEGTISGVSKTLIRNACSVYDGRRYWLSYTPSGSSYNEKIIIYDIYLKDWTVYAGEACNISYFERAYGGTDRGELYGGSSITNGFIYQLQASSGTESFTHNTEAAFLDGVTHNTAVLADPAVVLVRADDKLADSYTKLLIHFNGVDASTSYTTEDYAKRTVTFGDNAKLSTSTRRLGSASLSLDGTGDYVSVPGSTADWNFGAGDFTIDCWVKFNDITGQQAIVAQHDGLQDKWELVFNNPGDTNKIYFDSLWTGATTGNYQTTNATGITTNTWYHIAFVRSGSNAYLFINGVSVPLTEYTAWSTLEDLGSKLNIGMKNSNFYFKGYIDELRVSKGVARWTSDFTSPLFEYPRPVNSGTLTSQNIQINAAGSASLDKIKWLDNLPSNTKVSFQTRTGATNDSVFFNNWQYWSSANSVTLSTVTDATAIFSSSTNDGSFTVKKPFRKLPRNVLYYEDEDAPSVNCVSINTTLLSNGKYIEAFIPTTNLTDYTWLGGWFKSSQTGNTVEFYIGEGVSSSNYVTFNSVSDSTIDGWQKWWWYIGGITDKDAINYIKYRFVGDVPGHVAFGDISAYNLYNSEDTMTSTPNDWIQYRAILSSTNLEGTPELTSATLIYTPSLLVSETSLSSYYYTKWFDFKTPQINKTFASMVLEVNSTTASSVAPYPCAIYCDYDIDFGLKTGTLIFRPSTTANTVRILKNFPSATYGKSMRLKIYNNDKDAQVTVKGAEIRYRTESATPD